MKKQTVYKPMLIRRCTKGYNIRLYRNSTPGATCTRKYGDGSTEVLDYPSSKKYFVWVEGEVVKRTDSLKVAEEYYDDECKKLYDDTHGRMVIGQSTLINHIHTFKSEFPTASNTKSEIQDFLDLRLLSYGSKDTKAQLLDKSESVNPWSIK